MTRRYTKYDAESVATLAAVFKTRSQFFAEERGAYEFARREGILDDVCAHMETPRPRWTKEQALLEARKYDSATAFHKGSPGAYKALRRFWAEEKAAR